MPATIHPATLKFLKDLAANNNRDWFNAHKPTYLAAQQNMVTFIDQLIHEMSKHDELENTSGKQSLYRIYSDVRFRKDKSPYHGFLSFSLRRSSKLRRGGYYCHLEPGNTWLGCGFFNPNAPDLLRIRQDIDYNYDRWNKLLKSKTIAQTFGSFAGSTLATAPRGFDKNHPAIELLRRKQFVLRHRFTDEEVTGPDFLKEVNKTFKAVRPFFNYMSEVLTTDLNGEFIV